MVTLSKSAQGFSERHGKKGMPLYQNIDENLHRMKINRRFNLITEFEKNRNANV